MLASKYAQHLPLNRKSEIYAREGAALEVSTLADWVGACAASLQPILARIPTRIFAAERLQADDTTVSILARGKTTTGTCGLPCASTGPAPAAIHRTPPSSPRATGQALIPRLISPASAAASYAGFNRLYGPGRKPGPIIEAACLAHARRKLSTTCSRGTRCLVVSPKPRSIVQ